jgi:hypothetical protein
VERVRVRVQVVMRMISRPGGRWLGAGWCAVGSGSKTGEIQLAATAASVQAAARAVSRRGGLRRGAGARGKLSPAAMAYGDECEVVNGLRLEEIRGPNGCDAPGF